MYTKIIVDLLRDSQPFYESNSILDRFFGVWEFGFFVIFYSQKAFLVSIRYIESRVLNMRQKQKHTVRQQQSYF